MLVNFTKMHGLGNDFVVIDLITQNARLHTAHIKRIADRNFGIGCDQVILIEPPISEDRDFYYRIYNPNGSEVEQCGNGARCAARFFYDSGFMEHNRSVLKADCLAGPLELSLEANDNITAKLAPPIFELSKIPMISTQMPVNHLYSCQIDNEEILFFPVSMGNPHMVIQVPSIETAQLEKWGPILTNHPQYPQGANIEFMEIIDKHHIRLRVYERGVGETLACGSGACAAIVAGIQQDLLESPITVDFSKGALMLRWAGGSEPIYMTGPTVSVFMGRFRL